MIKTLKVKDFCCFENFELDLEKAGLVWITGNNKDTTSADNNGSGKSTILKSLTWVLYEKTIDGERAERIIRKGCSKAVVEIEIGEYTLIRERTSRSMSVRLIGQNGEIKLPRKELQEKIEEIIGLDFVSFRNTVLYGQNDKSRFVDPSTRDSERKEILHKILGFGIFKSCHEEARKRRSVILKEVSSVKIEIATLQAKIDENDVEEIKEKLEGVEEIRELKIKENKGVIKRLLVDINSVDSGEKKKPLKKLKEKLEVLKRKVNKTEYDSNKNKIDKLKEAVNVYREKRKNVCNKTVSATSDLSVLGERLSMLENSRCPICNSSVKKGDAKKHKAELQARFDQKFNEHSLFGDEEKALLEKIKETEKRIDVLTKKSDKQEELDWRIVDIERKIAVREEYNKNLKERSRLISERIDSLQKQVAEKKKENKNLRKEENPFVDMLEKANQKLKLYRGQLKETRREGRRLEDKLTAIEFWFHGFSNKGLPSFVLDGVMPILSERANHYLGILADGDITVDFSTQKQLKSNESRDTIDVRWCIEGSSNYHPSGGQLKKMEIATDLALMDLASQNGTQTPDILALDEIFDGLDDKGVQRVLMLLQELRRKRKSIFVISHDQRMSEIFEKAIVVTKKDGVSTLEIR